MSSGLQLLNFQKNANRVLAKLGNEALASSLLVELKHHFQRVLQDL